MYRKLATVVTGTAQQQLHNLTKKQQNQSQCIDPNVLNMHSSVVIFNLQKGCAAHR